MSAGPSRARRPPPCPPLIAALPLLAAACSGGGSAAPLEEKSGRFGDLGFLIRFPIVEAWNGRLLIALPGAGGRAAGLDMFAWPQITEGSAYAAIDSSDTLTAPLWRDALIAAERLIDPAYSLTADAAAYDLQARPKSVRQVADGLIPEGRLAVPTCCSRAAAIALPAWAEAYEARVLPPHSRAAVQRASA